MIGSSSLLTKRVGGCEFDGFVIGIVNARFYTSCSFPNHKFRPISQGATPFHISCHGNDIQEDSNQEQRHTYKHS